LPKCGKEFISTTQRGGVSYPPAFIDSFKQGIGCEKDQDTIGHRFTDPSNSYKQGVRKLDLFISLLTFADIVLVVYRGCVGIDAFKGSSAWPVSKKHMSRLLLLSLSLLTHMECCGPSLERV
jgi:hypothetical protein